MPTQNFAQNDVLTYGLGGIVRLDKMFSLVGEVNGRVFVNSAGVGIDGHVAQRIAATSRVTGKTFGYFAGSLVGIATYRPEPMRVLVDGELHSGRFLTVVAANGTHFGSGMHVAPEASLDDGHEEQVVLVDLYRASTSLGLLTGAITREDVFEEIFSKFCIGK